ncbi:thiamine pyrophosphate-binding protein [Phytohabitans suffuscus]|uniref:Acetolactate synthase n=1 Tax=Phytohabitans suffuscus TaxID=624315 RepID=A0A6F8YEL8_9ACTN|nr:thiamine pyrophosphate-binding protein [Phytohabitans suffuscus]BCB84546.1 acetolactate synthase [Phytohabitans suffuscus]
MNGYAAVPDLLARAGLTTVFGLVGSSNVAWVAHGVQSGRLRFIRVRHEESAVAAAAAFARTTSNVGVATVSRGPGFANTVNALAAAQSAHSPVLLIVGQSPTGKEPVNQNLDQEGIARCLGIGFHHVQRPSELAEAFLSALAAARWNGTPQVLSISEQLPGWQVDTDIADPAPQEPAGPDPAHVSAAVDLLSHATNPLVLAGAGAVLADCRAELMDLAERIGARLTSSLNAHRYFAGHPSDLGVCGTVSSPLAQEHFHRADVVLAVGASLNSYTTGLGSTFPHARVIQCEIDVNQPFRASATDLGLLGDARTTVRAITAEWRRRNLANRPTPAASPTLAEIQAAALKIDLGHDPARGLDPRHVYVALDRLIPQDRTVVVDAGRARHPLPMLLNAPGATRWIESRGYGTIGLGIGATIGAAAADLGTTVLICGDGGFAMGVQDLDAFRLNGLNACLIVINDEQYGSERKYVRAHDLPPQVARQPLPDVVTLAAAFGGTGTVVRDNAGLQRLRLPSHGLHIFDIRTDPEVDTESL